MSLKLKLALELALSIPIAAGALFMWHFIVPALGVPQFVSRLDYAWSELVVFFVIAVSYAIPLAGAFALTQRWGVGAHAVRMAYFGGWWAVVFSAAASVFHPAFLDILGLSLDRSGGAYFAMILVCGAAVQLVWTWMASQKAAKDGPKPSADGEALETGGPSASS